MKNLSNHFIVSLFPMIIITGSMSAQQINNYEDDVYDAGKSVKIERPENGSSPYDSSAYHDPYDPNYSYYHRPNVIYGGYYDPFYYPRPFWSFWPFYGYYRPHYWFGWGGWGWHNHGNHHEGGNSYYGSRNGNGRNNNRSSFYGQRREFSPSHSATAGTTEQRGLSPNRSRMGTATQRGLSQGRSSIGTAHSRPGSMRGGFGSTGRHGFSSGS